MSARETRKQTNVRLLPSELDRLRDVLGLPPDTPGAEVLREAVAHLTGIPAAQMVRRSGRPRKQRQAA